MKKDEKIVTAAIIRKDNKILISQRKEDSQLEPNKWEFPGGKVEPFETNEECLIREIKEELGITIEIETLLMKTNHIYIKNNKKIPITLVAYITNWKDGKVKNIDCQDSCWVYYKDLKKYDFAEADIPILNEFLTALK